SSRAFCNFRINICLLNDGNLVVVIARTYGLLHSCDEPKKGASISFLVFLMTFGSGDEFGCKKCTSGCPCKPIKCSENAKKGLSRSQALNDMLSPYWRIKRKDEEHHVTSPCS